MRGSSEVARFAAVHRADHLWMLSVLQGKEPLNAFDAAAEDTAIIRRLIAILRSGNLKSRNKSLTVLAKLRGIPLLSIAEFLHVDRSTTKRYWRTYGKFGCQRLFDGFYCRRRKSSDKSLCDAVFSLLHMPPSVLDLNRST
jgi:hypothetical protein